MRKYFTEFNPPDISTYTTYNIGRGKRQKHYISIPLSLDIETTSTLDNEGNEVAFMYIWMIGFDNICYYGRTIQELQKFLNTINHYLKSEEYKCICLIHFAPYEFAFLCNFFKFENIFATDKNKPIKWDWKQIEFRCSFVLSNMDLGTLAEKYCHTKKLKGDLDYNVVRYPQTPLKKLEMDYCENDVIILNEYWTSIYDEYLTKKFKWLPLTNTGKVRRYCQTHIPKDLNGKYHNAIRTAFPSFEIYQKLETMFQGGYVHANYKKVGLILSGVVSLDFASSYPAVMFEYKFPMGKFIKRNITDFVNIDNNEFAYFCKIRFYKIKAKTEISTISFSKLTKYDTKNLHIDNGRILACDVCEMYITDVDFESVKEFYSCENFEILELYTSKKGYLPLFLLESVSHFYNLKQTLKYVEGKEKLYMNSKNMLNSIFGMMVTKENHSVISFENSEWLETDGEYKVGRNQFLLFQWGVWVTAYARTNLLKTVRICHNDVVYCDTDSIKLLNYEKYKSQFENENERIENLIKNTCLEVGIPFENVRGLGLWDNENYSKEKKKTIPYEKFVTWGAKRYMADGKVTLSGFPKNIYFQNGDKEDRLHYLAKKHGKDAYEFFKPPMKLLPEESGKSTMKYNYKSKITYFHYDLHGGHYSIPIGSYIYSCPQTFKMSLSTDFTELVKDNFIDNYSRNYGGIKK